MQHPSKEYKRLEASMVDNKVLFHATLLDRFLHRHHFGSCARYTAPAGSCIPQR